MTSQAFGWVYKIHGVVCITTITTHICQASTAPTHIWGQFSICVCVSCILGHSSLHTIHLLIHILHPPISFKLFNIPMAFHLLNQKLQKQFQLHPNFPWKFKNQSLLHSAGAATASYLFILVGVGGFQAQGGLGGEELGLGERTKNKDIHIFWGGIQVWGP